MEYTDTFQRVEHKYLLERQEANELYKLIKDHLVDDVYPSYSLHNVYYDSADNVLIRRSLEGPCYKEKIRVRSYGEPDSDKPAYIELKKKYDGIVYKRRIQVKEGEINECMAKDHELNSQIGNEIAYVRDFYDVQAKMFIGYDRRAFAGKDEDDVRITFDTNIRYRLDHLSLHDDHPDEYLLDKNKILMEIKVMDRYPLWLSHALNKMKLTRTSFSKYGTIYAHLIEKERENV